ncbi:MAG: hypothetical protein C0626_10085 [Arcobacter sp.]|uniref:hypothetical protein n=1 Tax=uncultured Arcobacter sp. TaxID=165434 RepID=UPI000CAE7C9F|nr:hypothetical protein [uncultured Arcobacter sp.]PLY09331.1 MAG: hypothetical protein C0626_10085 [Arcobacter sp.]
MQVTNNQDVQAYNYKATKTQEVKTSPSAFDSLLEEKKEVSEKKEGRVLANIDKYNLYEDETKRFREILADDTVSLEEIDTLSYEEAKRFFSHMYPKDMESIMKSPLVKYGDNHNQIFMMSSSMSMSYDENFNEAMYRTYREIDTEEQRDIFDSTIHNLNTAYINDEQYEQVKNMYGENFIYNMLSNLKTEYSQNQDLRTKMLLDSYTLLQNNYNEVLNEKKEIYA